MKFLPGDIVQTTQKVVHHAFDAGATALVQSYDENRIYPLTVRWLDSLSNGQNDGAYEEWYFEVVPATKAERLAVGSMRYEDPLKQLEEALLRVRREGYEVPPVEVTKVTREVSTF